MSEFKSFAEEAQKHARDFEEIDVKFFSSRPSKFAKLAVRPPKDDQPSIKVGEEGFVFELRLPAFIRTIEFAAESTATKPPSLKVELLPITEDPAKIVRTYPHPETPNVLVAEVNAIVRGFRVAPEGWFSVLRSHKLSRITPIGYSLDDLENFEDAIFKYLDAQTRFPSEVERETNAIESQRTQLAFQRSELEAKAIEQAAQLKNEAQAAATSRDQEDKAHSKRLTEIEAAVQKKAFDYKELDAAIAKQKDESTQLGTRISQLEQTQESLSKALDEKQKKERDLDQRILEKNAALENKTQQEARLRDRLKELTNDVSLFAEDMQGIARQGGDQIKTYLWIVGACLIIGGILAIYSAYSTLQVFEIFVAKPELKVKDLILVKLPYILVISSIFHFLFKFAHPFLVRIREIHANRLRLSEISMLAREISDSALHGERINEEERAQIRLAVRMKFLRDHLTGVLDRRGTVGIEAGTVYNKLQAIAAGIIARGLTRKVDLSKSEDVILQPPKSNSVN